MRETILWLAGWIISLTREDVKTSCKEANAVIARLTDEEQEMLTREVNSRLGKASEPSELTLSAYQAMKSRMKNIFEMLWSVDITIEHKGRQLAIKHIVAAQPDPDSKEHWYLRLPDWSTLRFKPDMDLTPMHNLTCKTHMKEFFTLQRKLLKEQHRWTPDMDNFVDWQQVMVQSELMGDGSYVSYVHEAYDAHKTGLYHLEDKRTRRIDYEWGHAGDPMDKHQKGRKVKKLIDGVIPIDVGRLTIGDVKFNAKEMMSKPAMESYLWYQVTEMVRWRELELVGVGYPHMFSVPKKLSQLFENCYMPTEVGEKFAIRLGNAPYWKVKDKKRDRWYIYSYDWRLDRRKFAHSVIPIGHIEAYRREPGHWYFTMYSEDTLANRRNQSLWIADFRRKVITPGFCKWLGLRDVCIGETFEVSVYNDWAAKLWRELGEPKSPIRKLHTAKELRHVPETRVFA